MARIAKLVLDTIKHHPLHKMWLNLAKSLAEELGVELEVKEEDYVYAIDHGDTDELGMAWLPQLFAVLDNGEVKLVLSQFPFDPKTTKPDPQAALEEARRKIKEILES
ncbi:MAG: hypothetical protein GSR80_000938 [Desulfurococcales archaeon]|nr:hypothetical protein [Desulfurococcales archaeon]